MLLRSTLLLSAAIGALLLFRWAARRPPRLETTDGAVDLVDLASDHSFPASDPPSFTGAKA